MPTPRILTVSPFASLASCNYFIFPLSTSPPPESHIRFLMGRFCPSFLPTSLCVDVPMNRMAPKVTAPCGRPFFIFWYPTPSAPSACDLSFFPPTLRHTTVFCPDFCFHSLPLSPASWQPAFFFHPPESLFGLLLSRTVCPPCCTFSSTSLSVPHSRHLRIAITSNFFFFFFTRCCFCRLNYSLFLDPGVYDLPLFLPS